MRRCYVCGDNEPEMIQRSVCRRCWHALFRAYRLTQEQREHMLELAHLHIAVLRVIEDPPAPISAAIRAWESTGCVRATET